MFNLDASRVVAVFDADYFYCQVELNAVGDESLRSKPAAVFQKHLVVTCNYEARKYGVGKLMRVDEAKRLCPELVLFCGEDLTPYRDAQERICEALEEKLRSLDEVGREHRCETVGLDEYIFELTAVVDRRLRSMNAECAQKGPLNEYVGAVFPRDFMPESLQPDICLVGPEEELRLALGSDIAKNMRDAAFERTGITISCGVGFNKMLAKFAANMHKPNGQTTFVPTVRADSWLSELELRSLPYVGRRFERLLSEELHVRTVKELRTRFDSPSTLEHAIRKTFGKFAAVFAKRARDIWLAARGDFPEEVYSRGPLQRIHVEDSFPGLELFSAAFHEKLYALALACVTRMKHHGQQYGRLPRRVAVYWRLGKGSRRSRSTRMHSALQAAIRRLVSTASFGIIEQAQRLLFSQALQLLQKNLDDCTEQRCTLVGIGFSEFISDRHTEHSSLLQSALDMERERQCEAVFLLPRGPIAPLGTAAEPERKSVVESATDCNERSSQAVGFPENTGSTPGRVSESLHALAGPDVCSMCACKCGMLLGNNDPLAQAFIRNENASGKRTRLNTDSSILADGDGGPVRGHPLMGDSNSATELARQRSTLRPRGRSCAPAQFDIRLWVSAKPAPAPCSDANAAASLVPSSRSSTTATFLDRWLRSANFK